MFEVGGIGKIMQLGGMETMIVSGAEHIQWVQHGAREVNLYQCTECKEVKIY